MTLKAFNKVSPTGATQGDEVGDLVGSGSASKIMADMGAAVGEEVGDEMGAFVAPIHCLSFLNFQPIPFERGVPL
jgi:hypothetical protein